jgi:hypothetical protein
MMGQSIYSRDYFFRPVTLTATNNKFRVLIDPGGAATESIVTVPPGTYWLHGSNVTSHPGLYYQITSTLGAGWFISAATPSVSTGHVSGGVVIGVGGVSPPDDWEIDFQDADFTMDPRWFGFFQSELTVSSVTGTNIETITSKYAIRDVWRGETIIPEGYATQKRSRLVSDTTVSHERASDRYVLTWNQETWREYVIEYVSGAHIFGNRASNQAYANTARLALNDTHNGFSRIHDAFATDGEVIIYHNIGDGNWTTPAIGDAEVVKLRDVQQMQDLMQCVDLMQTAGEFYRIRLNLTVVDSDFAGYEH